MRPRDCYNHIFLNYYCISEESRLHYGGRGSCVCACAVAGARCMGARDLAGSASSCSCAAGGAVAAQAQYAFSRSNVLVGRHLGSRFNFPHS